MTIKTFRVAKDVEQCPAAPNGSRQAICIVAANSMTRAAELLGVTIGRMRRFGTALPDGEVELTAIARSRIGTVFWTPSETYWRPNRKWTTLRRPRDTIKSLASEIRIRFPRLNVVVDRGFASTDRDIPGSRLRHPGKGRHGTRIRVYDPNVKAKGEWRDGRNQPLSDFDPRKRYGELVLDHNNAETYRTTVEVRRWMESYRPGKGRCR